MGILVIAGCSGEGRLTTPNRTVQKSKRSGCRSRRAPAPGASIASTRLAVPFEAGQRRGRERASGPTLIDASLEKGFSGRIQAAEGQKVLLRQVDKALRPVVTGSGVPLVLAAAEPLAPLSLDAWSPWRWNGRRWIWVSGRWKEGWRAMDERHPI